MKSETIGELAKALAKAQSEIKGAIKDSENPFFKSKYADLESVWDACREPLTKHGLSVVQSFGFEGAVSFLETTLLHESGEWISGRQVLMPVKNDPQSFGSASTYNRRYGLAAIVGIIQTDDDAETAQARPISQQSSNNSSTKTLTITEKQQKLLWARAKEANWDVIQLKAYLEDVYKIDSIAKVPFAKLNDVLEFLKNNPKDYSFNEDLPGDN